jgi:hypothetical protein
MPKSKKFFVPLVSLLMKKLWEIYGFKWENWTSKVQSCCHNNRKKMMTILHYVFSRSYDLERRLCSQVCKTCPMLWVCKTSPMLWRKGFKKVLNFLLCIPECPEVQSQSLAIGCTPLSFHVPFFYRKIPSVMIHHWITLMICMFFP